MIRVGCCNPCDGITIDHWLNQTKVRRAAFTNGVDASGGLTITEVDPFARFDSLQYSQDNYPQDCSDIAPGECGDWIVGDVGDTNGRSSQTVESTVNDILACAADDATHAKVDHNCYVKTGTTTIPHNAKHGQKFVLAIKHWHGMFGFTETDSYAPDPLTSAAQTKYLKRVQTTDDWREESAIVTLVTYSDPGALPAGRYVTSKTQRYGDVTREVDRYTGNRTQSDMDVRTTVSSFDYTLVAGSPGSGGYVTGTGDETATEHSCSSDQATQTRADLVAAPNGTTDIPGLDFFQARVDDAVANGATAPTKTVSGWSFSYTWTISDITYTLDITVTRSNTSYSWSADYKTLQDYTFDDSDNLVSQLEQHWSYIGSIALSVEYTAAQFYADTLAAAAEWNLNSDTVYPWRTDEQLANGPLCMYSEVQSPVSQLGFNCPMEDYAGGLVDDEFGRPPSDPDYIETWGTRDWVDNYLWLFPDGGYVKPDTGFTGGATLLTGFYTGAIISHTPAGYARHFWFKFKSRRRDPQLDNMFTWVYDTIGAFSESPLPETSMRWMDKRNSQYDGLAVTNGADQPTGNFPQAFRKAKEGVMILGKYVEVKETWPKVNFARPCGADKFDVDQTTVCCVVSTGTNTFIVKKTGDAVEPLATGGLAVGDYVIRVADGVYQISGITDDGTVTDGDGNEYHQWTIAVGTKVDDLPTGGIVYGDARDDMDWIGRARWWDNDGLKAPGICGRAAITTSFSDPTLTITTGAQPYLRTGESVDLCASDMSVVATVTITRVSDTSFTCTHAATPTAVWMVPTVLYNGSTPGTKYQFNNTTSARTLVNLDWTFDQRKQTAASAVEALIAVSDPDAAAAQTAYEAVYGTYPPTWAAGTSGCTGLTVTQDTIGTLACYPAVVGVVPASETVDVFSNAVLFDFPATFTADDIYGAHWQGAVETTMTDPFWQQPFKPDCDIFSPDEIRWLEDDGSGTPAMDYEDITEGGATIYYRFYAHRPLVEALKDYPTEFGEIVPTLPAGLSLSFNAALNDIAPPQYPNGIPIGNDAGDYASLERPYGFRARACANTTRFVADYAYVSC